MLNVVQVDYHVFIVILHVVMLSAVMLIVLAPWPQLKTMNQHFDKNYQNVSVDDITSPRKKKLFVLCKNTKKNRSAFNPPCDHRDRSKLQVTTISMLVTDGA
jgi:hypothetical protein